MKNNTRPDLDMAYQPLSRQQLVITVAGLMLALFLTSLNQTVVTTALPQIVVDLGGFSQYTWVATSFLISSTVIVPIVGKLTDMFGRKLFYIIGIGIFTAGSLLSGFSQSINQLIIFRALQGIGGGIMMTNSMTVIADIFPPDERGKWTGLLSAVFGISSVVGPILGGFITDKFSWQWVFFMNVPLGLLVLILFIRFFPDIRRANVKRKVDYLGVMMLTLIVVPLMLALSWGGVNYPWGSAPIIGTFIFCAVMTVLFIRNEATTEEPLIPLPLFKNRIVSISLVITFFVGIGTFGVITFVPLFFQGVLGATATTSGSFLTPMMLGVVTGSLISGQLLSRTGGHYRLQGFIAIIMIIAGLILLSRMDTHTSYTIAVISIALTGLGQGFCMPCYTLSVQNTVEPKFLGVATSATMFFRSIGSTLGLSVFGSVMNTSFHSAFVHNIPAEVAAVVPQENLTAIAANPQALVSPTAQVELRELINKLGAQGTSVYEQLMETLRQSLSSSLSVIFLIGAAVIGVAFIVNFFFREVPLNPRIGTTAESVEEE
jgi:EmrB/QacA subfamily drug resistance transporter